MWEYRAALVRVHDADSAVLLLDTGMGGRQEEEVRLLGVSAPELSQPGGQESKAFTVAWFAGLTVLRWPLLVTTVPNSSREPAERRSFVRYLATVADLAVPYRVLNDALAEYLAGHPEWGSGA